MKLLTLCSLLALPTASGGVLDYLKTQAQPAEETSKYKAYAVLDAAGEKINAGLDTVKDAANAAQDKLNEGVESAKQTVGMSTPPEKTTMEKAKEAIKDTILAPFDMLHEGYQAAKDTIVHKPVEETAMDKANAAMHSVNEKVAGAVSDSVQSGVDAANMVHDKLNEGMESAKQTLGMNPPEKTTMDKAYEAVDATKEKVDERSILMFDEIACKVLNAFPSKSFSSRELAEAMSTRGGCGVGAETVRQTYLPMLRDTAGTMAGKCYDIGTKKWKGGR
jgi:hypothetical protein